MLHISLMHIGILTFNFKVHTKKVIAFEWPVNALGERQKAFVTLTSPLMVYSRIIFPPASCHDYWERFL